MPQKSEMKRKPSDTAAQMNVLIEYVIFGPNRSATAPEVTESSAGMAAPAPTSTPMSSMGIPTDCARRGMSNDVICWNSKANAPEMYVNPICHGRIRTTPSSDTVGELPAAMCTRPPVLDSVVALEHS